MKRLIVSFVTLIALAISLTAAAATPAPKDPILTTYEEARLALLKTSMPDVKTAAQHIVTAAHAANQHTIHHLADTLGQANDIKAARTAFAALSDEVIKYRATRSAEKTAVVYCSMEKKSWVQPAGEISNPYVSASMRTCGVIKDGR